MTLGCFTRTCFSVFALLISVLVGLILIFDTPPIEFDGVASTLTFANYAGNLQFKVQAFHQPENEQEVELLVQRARVESHVVRVVGAGHSWSPLVQTPDILVNLDKMNKILHVDKDTMQVRVQAGIRLKELGPQLWAHGLALPILGTVVWLCFWSKVAILNLQRSNIKLTFTGPTITRRCYFYWNAWIWSTFSVHPFHCLGPSYRYRTWNRSRSFTFYQPRYL